MNMMKQDTIHICPQYLQDEVECVHLKRHLAWAVTEQPSITPTPVQRELQNLRRFKYGSFKAAGSSHGEQNNCSQVPQGDLTPSTT